MGKCCGRPGLGLIVIGAVALGMPIAASAHAHTHAKATPHHHATTGKTKEKPKAAHHDSTPAGLTTIPAAGLKVYCAGRKSPLLVRKSTQGNGTTVTVICR